jgi:hypothetical protein
MNCERRYKIVCSVVSLIGLTQQSCISVKERESRTILATESSDINSNETTRGSFVISYNAFRPSRLPLESSIRMLFDGDVMRALTEADPWYRSASSDDVALQKLISNGFIPVQVQVRNEGSTPSKFSLSDLSLLSSTEKLIPIPPKDLPNELSEFNAVAVAANVYNTSIVVFAVAAVMLSSSKRAVVSSPFSDEKAKLYNSTTKTTEINYVDYLLNDAELAPNQSASGLVFFHTDQEPNWDSLRLQ